MTRKCLLMDMSDRSLVAMRMTTLTLVSAFTFLTCAPSPQVNTGGTPSTEKCKDGSNPQVAGLLGEASKPAETALSSLPKEVTFYGDLLPILRSSTRGEAYKCATCHPDFLTPDGMNSIPKIEGIVGSMKNGRMPRGGDLVPPEKIKLFTTWQLQGFRPGVPGASTPENLDTANADSVSKALDSANGGSGAGQNQEGCRP